MLTMGNPKKNFDEKLLKKKILQVHSANLLLSEKTWGMKLLALYSNVFAKPNLWNIKNPYLWGG
jgi:hypothetical protein